MNKRMIIDFLEPEQMRYKSCGDYFEDENNIYIQIVKQDNKYHSALILVHELIEFILTSKRGISEPAIMEYDLQWEKRSNDGFTEAVEPGNDVDCPYKKEHRFSENIERQLASELDLDWFEYEDNLKL